MNTGKTLFAQLMDLLPWTTFTRIVERHGGKRYAPHSSIFFSDSHSHAKMKFHVKIRPSHFLLNYGDGKILPSRFINTSSVTPTSAIPLKSISTWDLPPKPVPVLPLVKLPNASL